MSNTLLNGNDVITQDNMNVVKDYLNNNYSSVEVEFESTDGEVFMIIDGKKETGLWKNT